MFEKIFSYQPLLKHLCDFTPAADLLSLFDCDKYLHTFGEGMKNEFYFTKRVQHALKKAINCEKVYSALLAAPVNISGSFVLWALNGGNWNPGDIDIFIDEDMADSTRVKNFRKSCEHVIPTSNRYEFAPEEENNTAIKNVCIVHYTDDDKKEKTHLQLIYCDNALKNIKNFDLNFLKNVYNPKLGFTIHCRKNFMERESEPKIDYEKTPSNDWFKKIVKRARKYTKRGYNCHLRVEKLSHINFKCCGEKIIDFKTREDLEKFVPTCVRQLPMEFTNILLYLMRHKYNKDILKSIRDSINLYLDGTKIKCYESRHEKLYTYTTSSDDEKEEGKRGKRGKIDTSTAEIEYISD